eukprot:10888573-Prorocentrum_lima.AAC.1
MSCSRPLIPHGTRVERQVMSPSYAGVGASGISGEEDVVILNDELLMTSMSSTSTHQTVQTFPR